MTRGEIKERMERWMSDIRKRRDGGENYKDGCWRDEGMDEKKEVNGGRGRDGRK